ncbi:acetyl-CoA carboxylase biotin carboxyl carrier protein [Bariatricus sp. SGI.154]|uniref:acetyl-CoA carboxylase biotin carboxyl carrier protein n=1 Tax=Bariatricus sp. SGI.154 TaxID=3420549 RepID=UPI003CFC39EF
MELENLVKLIETVSASELTGLKYEENGMKLHLTKKKDQVQVVSAPVQMSAAAGVGSLESTVAGVTAIQGDNVGITNTPAADAKMEEQKADGKTVESPLVGTFYAAPSEDAAPFVSVGDTVKKGQTLAIIEAMKLMNEIESEYDGIVSEILAENGQAVEYGQPLFRIR